jgi:hypothetical protein
MSDKQVRTGQATTGHVTQSTNSQSKQTQRVKASHPLRILQDGSSQLTVTVNATPSKTRGNTTDTDLLRKPFLQVHCSNSQVSRFTASACQSHICRFSGTVRRTTLDAVENIRRLPVHMPSSCAGSRNRGSKVRAPKGKHPPRMQQRSTNLQSRHHTIRIEALATTHFSENEVLKQVRTHCLCYQSRQLAHSQSRKISQSQDWPAPTQGE